MMQLVRLPAPFRHPSEYLLGVRLSDGRLVRLRMPRVGYVVVTEPFCYEDGVVGGVLRPEYWSLERA